MRVIAGSCRSMPLMTLRGEATRPTTDRTKETLFNVLQDRIVGCRFLDLFAGSGAIGIEALSRGAAFACFVDNNREAISVIRKNLAFTHLSERARVLQRDALQAIRGLKTSEPFDILFLDPPYQRGLERDVIAQLGKTPVLSGDGLLVVEAARETDFSFLADTPFLIEKEKSYKTNKHLFLRRKEGD